MAIDIHINSFRNLITSKPKTDYCAFNNNDNPLDLNIITAANFDDFINTSIGSAFLRYVKENRFKDPVCDKTVWEKLASSERKFSSLSDVERQEVLDEFNRFHIQSFIKPDEYVHTYHEGGIKYIKQLIESPIGHNFMRLLKSESEKDELFKALHSQFVAADRDITLLGKGAQFLLVYLLQEYLKSMCQKACIPENAPNQIKAIIAQFKENKNFGSVKTLIEGQFKIITEDNFKTLINDKEFKIIFRRFQFHYGFALWNLFCKAGKSLICRGPVVPVLPDKDIPPDYIAEYHAKIRPIQVAFNALAENNGDIKAVPPFDRKIFLDELNKFIFEHFLYDTFITSGNIEEVYNSVYAQDFKDKFLKPQYPLLFNLVETTGVKQLFELYPNTANTLERLFNRWFLSDRKNIELSSSQLSSPQLSSPQLSSPQIQNQPQYVLDVLAWARGDDIADKKVLPQISDAKYTENRKFAIITLENFDEYINDAEIGDKFIYVFLKGKYLEFEKEMEKLRQNSDISYTEAFKLRQIMPKLQRLSEIYKKLLVNKSALDEEGKKFLLDDFNKFHFANFKYRKYFDFSDVSHTAIEIGSFVFPSNQFVPPFSHNRYAQIISVLLSPYGRDFLDNKLAKEKPYSYVYETFRACRFLIPEMEKKHKEELDILMACLIMYIQTSGESIKLNPDIENALGRKHNHDCAIPDNTEGLISLVNVLEKIAFSHKETSIKPVEKVKKPKHSTKKFNIITAANFKEYLESDIGKDFKTADGISNVISGCGADISKLPEEQQFWLLAKFNDFYLENYKYETYVQSDDTAETLKTIYGAHFKGLLEEECPLLYQSLEKNGMTGANSFFITARLNTYFKSGRKTTVTASINISAEEQDEIIKENSGKVSAILENGIKPKKEKVSPVHVLLNFLVLAVDEYSKEKTKLTDFPLNEILEIINLNLEILNLEKFTFEAFDAKYRALALKDDLMLIAITDTGAIAINKVTGKKVFLSDEQIIARGMNKEHKGWQDTAALNALVEHWDKMLIAAAKLCRCEARIYYKVKPRLEEKYGKDSSALKAVFKLVENAACAVTGEQKYPQVSAREKESPEYEFKESIFKIICYNVQHENAELNKFGMLLSNSLYLKFDFLEGKKPTWFNVAQGLRKAEKLNFRSIKTQKEIQIDCKNFGSILKPVGDRLIDIGAVLQTSPSSNTGTSAPDTSAEREIIQIILGAAKGILVDFPLMAAHMTINPLAAKLFFWNFAHPESLEAALTEFFNIMEKGNRFDTAAYFSFNLTLLALMFKGGMEAFHGKTFAVEGRKTISGIEVLINGNLCNELASKTLLEVLKIRPEDIENKKIELSLKKRDDGIIELSNGAKLTEDGAKCLSGALKSGFTLGIKRAPSEKPGEPGELRFTLNGILLGKNESKEIIKAIIEARLKPESVEVESGGKRMRITGGVDDLKIENLSSGSGGMKEPANRRAGEPVSAEAPKGETPASKKGTAKKLVDAGKKLRPKKEKEPLNLSGRISEAKEDLISLKKEIDEISSSALPDAEKSKRIGLKLINFCTKHKITSVINELLTKTSRAFKANPLLMPQELNILWTELNYLIRDLQKLYAKKPNFKGEHFEDIVFFASPGKGTALNRKLSLFPSLAEKLRNNNVLIIITDSASEKPVYISQINAICIRESALEGPQIFHEIFHAVLEGEKTKGASAMTGIYDSLADAIKEALDAENGGYESLKNLFAETKKFHDGTRYEEVIATLIQCYCSRDFEKLNALMGNNEKILLSLENLIKELLGEDAVEKLRSKGRLWEVTSTADFLAVLIKHGGNREKVANELRISEQSVTQRALNFIEDPKNKENLEKWARDLNTTPLDLTLYCCNQTTKEKLGILLENPVLVEQKGYSNPNEICRLLADLIYYRLDFEREFGVSSGRARELLKVLAERSNEKVRISNIDKLDKAIAAELINTDGNRNKAAENLGRSTDFISDRSLNIVEKLSVEELETLALELSINLGKNITAAKIIHFCGNQKFNRLLDSLKKSSNMPNHTLIQATLNKQRGLGSGKFKRYILKLKEAGFNFELSPEQINSLLEILTHSDIFEALREKPGLIEPKNLAMILKEKGVTATALYEYILKLQEEGFDFEKTYNLSSEQVKALLANLSKHLNIEKLMQQYKAAKQKCAPEQPSALFGPEKPVDLKTAVAKLGLPKKEGELLCRLLENPEPLSLESLEYLKIYKNEPKTRKAVSNLLTRLSELKPGDKILKLFEEKLAEKFGHDKAKARAARIPGTAKQLLHILFDKPEKGTSKTRSAASAPDGVPAQSETPSTAKVQPVRPSSLNFDEVVAGDNITQRKVLVLYHYWVNHKQTDKIPPGLIPPEVERGYFISHLKEACRNLSPSEREILINNINTLAEQNKLPPERRMTENSFIWTIEETSPAKSAAAPRQPLAPPPAAQPAATQSAAQPAAQPVAQPAAQPAVQPPEGGASSPAKNVSKPPERPAKPAKKPGPKTTATKKPVTSKSIGQKKFPIEQKVAAVIRAQKKTGRYSTLEAARILTEESKTKGVNEEIRGSSLDDSFNRFLEKASAQDLNSCAKKTSKILGETVTAGEVVFACGKEKHRNALKDFRNALNGNDPLTLQTALDILNKHKAERSAFYNYLLKLKLAGADLTNACGLSPAKINTLIDLLKPNENPAPKLSGPFGDPSSAKDNFGFTTPNSGHFHHKEPAVHPNMGGPMPGNKRFNYPGQQPQQPEPQINSKGGAGNGNTPNKSEPAKKSNGTGGGVPELTGAAKRLNDLNAKIEALIAQKSRYADIKLLEFLEEYNEICRGLKHLDENTNNLLTEVYKNISEAPSKLGFAQQTKILSSFLAQAFEKCNEAYRKLNDSDALAKDLLVDVYRNILETSSKLDFPEGIKFLSSFLKKAPEEVLIRRISTFTSMVLELPKVKNPSQKCSTKIFDLKDYLSLRDETCKKINELSDKTEDRTASVFLRAALNDFTEKFYNAVVDIISELDIETRSEFLLTFLKTIPDETLNNHLAALSYLVNDLVSKRMESLMVLREKMEKSPESTELFLYIKECNERFEELKKFSALNEKKQGLIDPSRVAREKRELITIHYSGILSALETQFKDNVEVKRLALNSLPDEVLREDCVSKRIPNILTDKLTKEQEKELGILRHNLKAPFEALPATFDVFSRLLRKNKVNNPALYEKMSILHDKASALFTKVTKYFSKDSDSFTSANFRKELLEKTNDLRREVEEIGSVIKDTDFSGVPDSMKFLVESIIDSPKKIRKEIDKIESSLKLDKAYIQSNSNEFNLRSFTENIKADFVNRPAKGRPVTILVQIPENLSAYANEQALTEMFRNVLDNDIKIFDMDSTKKINETRGCVITITAKEDAAGMTEIFISDNGPGVHRDRKSSILIGDSTTGGGFGLQRCVELALSHGGEFYEDGVFGIGAKFVIKLPRKPKEAGKYAPQNQAQPQKGTDFPATNGGHNHHRDWPTHPEAGGESPVNRRRGINGSNSGGGSNWRRKVDKLFPAELPQDKNLSPAELREINKKRSAQEMETKILSDFESLTPFIDETLASCGFSRLETHIVSCRNILAEINDCLDSKNLSDESKTRLLDKKEQLINTYFPNIFEKARDLLKNKKIDARNIRTLYSQLPEKIKQTASMRSIIQEIGEEIIIRDLRDIQSWSTFTVEVKAAGLDINPYIFLTNLWKRIKSGEITDDALFSTIKDPRRIDTQSKAELISEIKEKIESLYNQMPSMEKIASSSKPMPIAAKKTAAKKIKAPKPKEKPKKTAPKATALSEYIANRKIKLAAPETSILKHLANNRYSEAGKVLKKNTINITEFKDKFLDLICGNDIPYNKRLEIIGDLGFAGIEEARSKVMKFYIIQKAPKLKNGNGSQAIPQKTAGPRNTLEEGKGILGFSLS